MENRLIYTILAEFYTQQLPVGASTLKDVLDMSQASIGRALIALEKEGYLTKVSNKGRIITTQGIQWYEAESARLDKQSTANELISRQKDTSSEKLKETIYIRKLLEPQAIALACEHASDQAIDDLRRLIHEHIYHLSQGQEGTDVDLKIHLRIAELSGNETMFMVLKLLLTDNNSYINFSHHAVTAMRPETNSLINHTDILEALLKRDSQAASEAMLRHLVEIEKSL